jgi:RecJ-like exonuclease
MRALVVAIMLPFTAVPASAQAVIGPCDALKHVGETVTVEGLVEQVNHPTSGYVTFINMCGRFPKNSFQAAISDKDIAKFPNIEAIDGKTVNVTGIVKRRHKDHAEIILDDPTQLKSK